MNESQTKQGLSELSILRESILIIDYSGMITDVTGPLQTIFGYTKDEIRGLNFNVLMPTLSGGQRQDGLPGCSSGILRQLAKQPIPARHKDGNEFLVELSVEQIGLGEQHYFAVLVHDQSQALATSNILDRLGRILDASWEEVYVFEAETLRFIQVSRGALHNLGYSLNEMLQITPVDIKPDFNAEKFRAMIALLLNGRENILSFNTHHQRKDKSIYPVEIRLQYAENETPTVFVALVQDVSEQHRIERRLQESEQRLSLHVQQTPLGVIDWNLDFEVMEWNPAAEQIFGYPREEALGQHAARLIVPLSAREQVDSIWQTLLEQKGGLQMTNENIAKDGRTIMCEWYNTPLVNQEGVVVGVSSLVQDITKRLHAENKLSYQASHDELTGLVNRREFDLRLHEFLENARASGMEHALLYLDLDQFKVINDTCGHVAGDELLKQLSIMLSKSMRASDTFARLGGDEFGVLLENCPIEDAKFVANTLRQTVKNFRFVWQEITFDLSVSIGLVSINAKSENESNLLSAADVACYAAKETGRNRLHVYETCDVELAQRHGEMHRVTDITKAINEDRLCLYVQEIRPLDTDKNSGSHYEVLVRMNSESGRLLLPGAFLPAAERYNLMPAIDQWVISKAFSCLGSMLAMQNWTESSMLTINLSGHSLNHEEFLDYVKEKIKEYTIPHGRICFEITETVAVANLPNTIVLINELKEYGCCFALDDFGSGVSSFSYLKNLPVDYLKIDGEFVRDMTNDSIDFAMVETINKMGQLMGYKTIAEYVENEEILQGLNKIGVNFGQGFLIDKPKPLRY